MVKDPYDEFTRAPAQQADGSYDEIAFSRPQRVDMFAYNPSDCSAINQYPQYADASYSDVSGDSKGLLASIARVG